MDPIIALRLASIGRDAAGASLGAAAVRRQSGAVRWYTRLSHASTLRIARAEIALSAAAGGQGATSPITALDRLVRQQALRIADLELENARLRQALKAPEPVSFFSHG